MVKERYITNTIKAFCFNPHKMAFISGPRQCGKTTLSKALLKERGLGHYYNWDEKEFRRTWAKTPSKIIPHYPDKKHTPLIILDEIHKAKLWKRDLKGIFDTLEQAIDIIVTGSAKLNIYRRGGDSLLGRYHHFRLHPFSLAELLNSRPVEHTLLVETIFSKQVSPSKACSTHLEQLYLFGPFPEPLFSKNEKLLRIWQRERLERLIREDLRDISRIQELSQIEMLVSLLPERAASALSITSLKEDLEVAYATMKLWLNYLKQIYYIYEIKPYSHSIPRSLKKEGKLYLWDWSEIENPGARFENMIANHLLKYAHFLTDSGEANVELCYLKNKQKLEIDFLLVKNKQPWLPIEVKLTDSKLSKNWQTYLKHLPCKRGLQIVKTPGIYKHYLLNDLGEVLVISAEYVLALLV